MGVDLHNGHDGVTRSPSLITEGFIETLSLPSTQGQVSAHTSDGRLHLPYNNVGCDGRSVHDVYRTSQHEHHMAHCADRFPFANTVGPKESIALGRGSTYYLRYRTDVYTYIACS